jgi:epoxyqueuosine reductase QueG
MAKLEDSIKQFARELGFSLSGIARAAPADQFDRLNEWIDRGYAGEMEYMRRHAEARKSPASILPDVRSVIMLGMEYKDKQLLEEPNPPASPSLRGKEGGGSPPSLLGKGVGGLGSAGTEPLRPRRTPPGR